MATASGNLRRANRHRRALLVANEAIRGEELRHGLLAQLGDQVEEVFVVAPAMTESGLDDALGDIDRAIGPAEERLRRTLEELRSAGVKAEGEVGDSDPLQAIQDELLKFRPDRIVVVAHRDGDGAFAEKGLLEQAERDLELPVTELVVDKATAPHLLDVQRTEYGAGRDKDWEPSHNWPPLSPRNVVGILVAVLGTLLLGILAAKAVGDANGFKLEEGRLGATEAATILIALGMALLNLAHVVGLFLFQSTGYEGIWSRFFARISLFGTPLAVVAAAVMTFLV